MKGAHVRTTNAHRSLTHEKRHAPKCATNPQAHKSTRQAALPLMFLPSFSLLSFASIPSSIQVYAWWLLVRRNCLKLSANHYQLGGACIILRGAFSFFHTSLPSLSFTRTRRLLFPSCLIMHRSVPLSSILPYSLHINCEQSLFIIITMRRYQCSCNYFTSLVNSVFLLTWWYTSIYSVTKIRVRQRGATWTAHSTRVLERKEISRTLGKTRETHRHEVQVKRYRIWHT